MCHLGLSHGVLGIISASKMFHQQILTPSSRSGRSDSADLISTNQDKKEKDLQNPLEIICNPGFLKKQRNVISVGKYLTRKLRLSVSTENLGCASIRGQNVYKDFSNLYFDG